MTHAATAGSVVDIQRRGNVALVVVDNPPVNALSDPTLEALGAAAEAIGADADVRAVVLTGDGKKAFMAGADIVEFNGALGDEVWLERHTQLTRQVFGLWEALPQPVVAAVQAPAVGGGLEMMLVCDFAVADPAAKFGFPEIGLGLIPGAGGTQRLPRVVPRALAREMVMLGTLIDAETARACGLVNWVSEPGAALAEATAVAERIAALPALAVRASKQALRAADESLAAGLDLERVLFGEVFGSPDAREGVSAFVEKRPARFG